MRKYLLLLLIVFTSCTDWDLPEERPVASVLTTRAITDSSVTLQWTSADSRNFSAYHVYKGEGSIVDTTDELLDTIIFLVDTVYTVRSLQPNSDYSFRIMTAGKTGSGSVSNTIEVRTNVDLDNETLKLHTPDTNDVTDHSVDLRWSQSWEWDDDVEYRVFMDTVAPVDSLDSLVATVSEKSALISGLRREQTYHFRVFMAQKDSSKAGSNSESITTKSGEPKAVTIVDTVAVTDQSVSLRYTKSTDSDFAYYCLWQDTETGVDSLTALDTNSSHATVVYSIDDTTVSVESLLADTKYYFSLYVVDTTNLFTPSKVYSVTTKDTLFNQFTTTAGDITDTTLTLSWDKYDRTGFVQYEIYTDSVPTVDTNSTLLKSISTITTTTYDVTALAAMKQHFFRIYVRGTSGIEMRSNVVFNYNSIIENLVSGDTTVPLIWRSVNSLDQFDRVKLFRSTEPIKDDKLIPLQEFNAQGTSSYIDTSASVGDHYYRLYYYSSGVKSGESNQINVTVAE